MLAQIPDGAAGLDQLVCVALGLPRSGWQDPAWLDRRDRGRRRFLWPPADCVNIAQVTLYSKELGAAIAQATYDTRENHGRAVLRELLSTMDLEGVLIQAVGEAFSAGVVLHTQKPFSAAHGAGGRLPLDRCRRSLPRSGERTKGNCIARSATSSSIPARSLSRQRFPSTVTGVIPLGPPGPNRLLTSSPRIGPAAAGSSNWSSAASVTASPPSSGTSFSPACAPRQKPCCTGEGPLVH
jgi:hypothetical protein